MFLFLLGLFIGSIAGMMLMAILASSKNNDEMTYKA